MNLTTTICVAAVMSASAWAQLANPIATIDKVKTRVGPATSAVAQRTNSALPQAAPQSKTAATPAGVPRPKTNTGKAGQQETPSAVRMRGKRDPFVSVIRMQPAAAKGCATGKQCLAIGDIALKGIVRSPNGMIAVVENAKRKTYFLHENDPVFNGHVVRIESDGIVFRETVVDRVGRQSSRDVVKRISKPSIS